MVAGCARQLQVVAGWSPLASGIASLPTTLLMMIGSSRAGALGERIGPRLPMSVGPIVMALGIVLLLRTGPTTYYVLDVLPGVVVFGLGLTLMVAPLTATALSSAPDEHAGLASGINNAVARAGHFAPSSTRSAGVQWRRIAPYCHSAVPAIRRRQGSGCSWQSPFLRCLPPSRNRTGPYQSP